jgi:hypothetical protein
MCVDPRLRGASTYQYTRVVMINATWGSKNEGHCQTEQERRGSEERK